MRYITQLATGKEHIVWVTSSDWLFFKSKITHFTGILQYMRRRSCISNPETLAIHMFYTPTLRPNNANIKNKGYQTVPEFWTSPNSPFTGSHLHPFQAEDASLWAGWSLHHQHQCHFITFYPKYDTLGRNPPSKCVTYLWKKTFFVSAYLLLSCHAKHHRLVPQLVGLNESIPRVLPKLFFLNRDHHPRFKQRMESANSRKTPTKTPGFGQSPKKRQHEETSNTSLKSQVYP